MKDGKLGIHGLLRILMVLCLLGIAYSTLILYRDNREYAKGETAYEELRHLGGGGEEKKEKQDREVDFISLQKINPDVVGWIVMEGTEIDYPIVQGQDNHFYLEHLFSGEDNKLGTIFMDYRNHSDFSDKNTIIYGHNMKDGSMFASLEKYKDQEYYQNYPTMTLYTPVGDFNIDFFAGIVVDGHYESIPLDFEKDMDFQSYIDSLKKQSTFQSNAIVKAEDRIVTLCTCTYEFDNARFLLFGLLKPKRVE